MSTNKVIGEIQVADGNIKIINADGLVRDAAYGGVVYEGEQIVSNDPNGLFQINYLDLDEAVGYSGIFKILADGSVVYNVDESENVAGNFEDVEQTDVGDLETAAGEEGVEGSSMYIDPNAERHSSVLGFDRSPDPVTGITEVENDIIDPLSGDIETFPMSDENEALTTAEDTVKSGNVMDVTDADSSSHSVTTFTVDGDSTIYNAGDTATTAAGTITIASDGEYTFTPAANFVGDMPQVTYSMVDNNDSADTDTSTLDIEVTPVNDGPIANPDSGTTNVEIFTSYWSHDLNAGNDYTNDGVTITPINGLSVDRSGPTMGVDGFPNNDSSQQLNPGEGIKFVFTDAIKLAELHLGNFNNNQDTASWTILNGTTEIATGVTDSNSDDIISLSNNGNYFDTIIIENIDGHNFFSIDQVLASSSGSNSLIADSQLYFPESELIANDIDIDGDELNVVSIDDSATQGVATMDADGNILYNPNGAYDYLGEGETAVDSISYTISDGNGGESTSTINITIEGLGESDSSYNGENLIVEDGTLDLSNISSISVVSLNSDANIIGTGATTLGGNQGVTANDVLNATDAGNNTLIIETTDGVGADNVVSVDTTTFTDITADADYNIFSDGTSTLLIDIDIPIDYSM